MISVVIKHTILNIITLIAVMKHVIPNVIMPGAVNKHIIPNVIIMSVIYFERATKQIILNIKMPIVIFAECSN
jgi:hypothetical protein